MTSQSLLGLSVAVFAFGCFALRAQEPLVIGPAEVTYLGAATNEAVSVPVLNEGSLRKVGAGDLALPLARVSSREGQLDVLDGSATLTADGTYELAGALPAALRQKAAFWLDANTNVVTLATNGQLWVQQWLDVREPNVGGPYQYLRAAGKSITTNDLPILIEGSPFITNGMPYIDFGVFGGGRWMEWQDASSNRAPLAAIRNAFLVFSARESYGFLLGSHNGGTPDFHISNLSSGTNAPLWSTGDDLNELLTGSAYLDRVRIDGTKTQPKKSAQLLEIVTGLPCYASNFCNDRNIYYSNVWRVGGGHFCEVLIYTNQLSEAERLRVQQYLWQKWLSPAQDTPGAFVAPGATSTVSVASSAVQPLKLAGAGTVVKAGAGTLQPQVSTNAPLSGDLALAEGLLDVRMPLPLRAASGVRFQISTNILTAAAAQAGQFVKAGGGEVVLKTVPDAVKRIDVSDGILNLTQSPAAETWPTNTAATIPNPSFEAFTFGTAEYMITVGATVGGWTSVDNGYANNSAVYLCRDDVSTTTYNWMQPGSAPDGHTVLMLKRLGAAETTVTLPADGVYDFSFWTAARLACFTPGSLSLYNGHEFDILIDQTQRVATVQTMSAAFQRFRYRLPRLTAGPHTLRLNSVTDVDYASLLDDLRIDLVSPAAALDAVPNGSFECVEFSDKATAVTAPTNAIWSFAVSGSNTAGIATLGASFFNTPNDGRRALYILNQGQVSAPVTVSASGTYELVIVSKACKFYNNYKTPVNVTVQVGGTTAGTLSNDIVGYYSTFVSQPFDMVANTPLTLTLTGVYADMRQILIDRIELRRYVQRNIVANGSFESDASWNRVSRNGYANFVSGVGNDWGMVLCDGPRRLLINRNAYAWQPLTLTQPGDYRLIFHAISRVARYGAPSASAYGLNPLKAWISRNGATNVIGYMKTYDEIFRRHELLFRVPEAGSYDLGIEGLEPAADKTSIIDAVSVEKVELAPFGTVLPKACEIAVAPGAKLILNFLGTNKVDFVRYNGASLEGVISAATHPEFVSGSGALAVSPKGTLISVR